jgi:glycosyltransferase involved in cell wall biosynthesis
LKILVVNWRCIKNPEMGGAEIHLHEIFRRIVKMGHDVTLVAHKFSGAPNQEIIDGIKIIRNGNKFLFNHQFKNFYKSELSKNKFDLIVDDISKIPLNISKYVKEPVVGILHHIHGNSLYKEIPFPLAFYIINQEKKIPQNYSNSKIFTVSKSTSNELIKLGYPNANLDILYNAIDQDLFKNTIINKSELPLITYVGRIKNYKNIDQVIKAVKILKREIPEIKLVIGGKGDNSEKLKELVKQENLENNVEFTGFLTEMAKAELLGKAWLFVTMAEKEGWGITVIEANAMKTPTIGSDVPGLRDSIKNGETGYLVELGNINELALKITEVISSKSILERLSENAYNWSNNFSWEKSAEHFIEKVVEWYPQLK